MVQNYYWLGDIGLQRLTEFNQAIIPLPPSPTLPTIISPEQKKKVQVGKYFFIWWTLSNLASFAIGVILAAIATNTTNIAIGVILGGFLVGLTVGTMQWLVLRRYLNQVRGWILATIIGSSIGSSLIALFIESLPFEFDILAGILIFSLVGTCIGTPQWFVLRKKVDKSIHWVAVNAIVGSLMYPL